MPKWREIWSPLLVVPEGRLGAALVEHGLDLALPIFPKKSGCLIKHPL